MKRLYRVRIKADFIMVAATSSSDQELLKKASEELLQVHRWSYGNDEGHIAIEKVSDESEIPKDYLGARPWGDDRDDLTVEDFLPGPLEQLAEAAE